MGKTLENVTASGFTGKVGKDLVFRQTKSGRTVVARPPKKSDKEPAESQRLVRKKFKRAALYAKMVQDNDQLRAPYEATKGTLSAFNLALRDASKSPEIMGIDTGLYRGRIGDKLIIDAVDDFKVASVHVSILAANGALIEDGNAVIPEAQVDWVYTSTVANDQLAGTKIIVRAADLPGNTGVKEVTL